MSGTGLVLHGEDERALARLMARARLFASVPGLRKEIAGKPDAVAGIMLSLEGYGIAATLPAINNSFDWIQGQAVLSSQTYQALARMNGYSLVPLERTATRATARIEAVGVPPVEVTFTIDDAIAAGRLDEWVEQTVRDGQWRDGNPRYKVVAKFMISVNGVPNGEEPPEWVAAEVAAGRVKRFDAWWNYRTDMLWKSAAKRAVKIAAPHVVLGDVADHGASFPPAVQDSAPPGPPAGGNIPDDDDEITDAEIVEEPPAQKHSSTDGKGDWFDESGKPF